jgi:hypothetical protein
LDATTFPQSCYACQHVHSCNCKPSHRSLLVNWHGLPGTGSTLNGRSLREPGRIGPRAARRTSCTSVWCWIQVTCHPELHSWGGIARDGQVCFSHRLPVAQPDRHADSCRFLVCRDLPMVDVRRNRLYLWANVAAGRRRMPPGLTFALQGFLIQVASLVGRRGRWQEASPNQTGLRQCIRPRKASTL